MMITARIHKYVFPVLLITTIFSYMLFLFLEPPFFTATDMNVWNGSYGKLVNCWEQSRNQCSGLGMFPIAYLLNSMLVSVSGFTPNQALLFINIIFLGLPIAFISLTNPTQIVFKKTGLYLAGLSLTPIAAFYVYSGALELQSGVMLGLLLSAAILLIDNRAREHKVVINTFLVVTLLMCPWYKDTILPVLVACFSVFGLLYINLLKRSGRRVLKELLGHRSTLLSAIAIASSALILVAYNLYKAGSIFPLQYIRVAELTSPSYIKSIEFLFASVFSPNGGVIVFWSLSFYCVVILARRIGLAGSPVCVTITVILVLASLVGQSFWWAPFGWDSWGNRLMVPAMLASLISIILTMRPGQSEFDSRKATKRSARGYSIGKSKFSSVTTITTSLFALVSLCYVTVSFYSDKQMLFHLSLNGGSDCKNMLIKMQAKDWSLKFWKGQDYYDCATERFFHIPQYVR